MKYDDADFISNIYDIEAIRRRTDEQRARRFYKLASLISVTTAITALILLVTMK